MVLGEIMKVIDVIELTAKLLSIAEVKQCVELCKTNQITLSQLIALPTTSETEGELLKPDFLNIQVEKELRLLLDCVNITQTQIASEKNYIFKVEDIAVENECFDIDTLSQKLYKIKEITSDNEKRNFDFIGNKIIIKNGNYKLKYAYLPDEIGFDDSIETHGGKVSILAFCYGVCSKYLLIKNMFDEASLWQEKFDKSLSLCFKKLGEIKIKNRRWL